jgi:hypothetical protein
MNKQAYAKYASKAERALDELYEAHLNYECDRSKCSWCLAEEVEAMAAYFDSQRNTRSCPRCGSTETIYENDREVCADCGK